MMKLSKLLCILAAFFSTSAALAENSGWVISEADGQVSITRNDKAIYGARGTQLQVGDVVRTRKAARAVLAHGKEFVIVSSDERVRIVKAKKSGAVGQFVQFLGSMFNSNDKHSTLNRPLNAAVVKGYGSTLTESEGTEAAEQSAPEGSEPTDGE